MIDHSQIFRGEVVHERVGPVSHEFTYPMTFFAFDLAELPSLHRQAQLFGYNERNLLTLRDVDYLHGKTVSIVDQLSVILGPEQPGERTMLVTSPRYFGYAFNPVNFHLRLKGEELLAVVAEVNNTFGDRHIYPLTDLVQNAPCAWSAECPKDFHVSPFNNMEGDYHFTFRITGNELFLGVDLHRDGTCVMKTWIRGEGHAMNRSSIFRYALLHPFDTALNSMPRILWQAGQLYFKKRMEVYKRPSPDSAHTLIDSDASEGRRQVI